MKGEIPPQLAKHQWVKGQCGNPHGRSKAQINLRLLAQQHTRTAMAVILAVMRDAKASDAMRLKASEIILDRGYGKPAQEIIAINGTPRDNLDLKRLSEEQFEEFTKLVEIASKPEALDAPTDPT